MIKNEKRCKDDMPKNSTNKEGEKIKCLKHTVPACRTEIN